MSENHLFVSFKKETKISLNLQEIQRKENCRAILVGGEKYNGEKWKLDSLSTKSSESLAEGKKFANCW